MTKDKITTMLFVSESANYGDKYIEHLLEQYKIYLSAIEKISDRRQKTNEFFLALNTSLVTLLGFLLSKQGTTPIFSGILYAALAGIILCYLWYRIVRSYKGLNTGKLLVIHAIESRLPLALYDTEWELLGRGQNRKIYWPFTHIELLVPWVYIFLFSLVVISSICWT